MLFLVPDLEDKNTQEEGGSDKSTEGLGGGESKNVELDLDDAPFLNEEIKEKPSPPPETTEERIEEQEKSTPLSKKDKIRAALKSKKVRIILLGLIVLLLSTGIAFFFLSGGEPESKNEEPTPAAAPAAAPEENIKTIVISTNATANQTSLAPPAKYIIQLDPFTVPLKGSEGEIVLFTIQLSIPTDNPAVNGEIKAKTILLRDAIYYYLSRKSLTALVDSKNALTVRNELVLVINEHLTTGKIDKVYIEDYFSEHL